MGCKQSKYKMANVKDRIEYEEKNSNENERNSPTTSSNYISSLERNSIDKKSIVSTGWNFRIRKSKEKIETIYVDPLYVVIPYFNYCHYRRRKDLFMEFYMRIKDNPRLRIIVCEATEIGHDFELPQNLPNVLAHIHVTTKNQIWIKESLVNIAVSMLPKHWKYMAWLDCDIEFDDIEWVEKTIESLERYDIVQLFSNIVYLGPNNEHIKKDRSFGYMYRKSGKPYTSTYRYGFWHPGFAWACTKSAYSTMGGLIDYAILGSGDHHMALGLISKIECSHPKDIHPSYRKLLREFEKRVSTLYLGYVDGTILHHWHGDLKLRRYKERWQILVEHKYSPLEDIYKDPLGLWQLTDSGKRLDKDIRDYFAERKEDDKRIMS